MIISTFTYNITFKLIIMAESNPRTVLVTGFGPFGIHNINASWQAVKKLSESSSEKLKKLYNINLIIEEIPVRYDYVFGRIPELWKEHKPLVSVYFIYFIEKKKKIQIIY